MWGGKEKNVRNIHEESKARERRGGGGGSPGTGAEISLLPVEKTMLEQIFKLLPMEDSRLPQVDLPWRRLQPLESPCWSSWVSAAHGGNPHRIRGKVWERWSNREHADHTHHPPLLHLWCERWCFNLSSFLTIQVRESSEVGVWQVAKVSPPGAFLAEWSIFLWYAKKLG